MGGQDDPFAALNKMAGYPGADAAVSPIIAVVTGKEVISELGQALAGKVVIDPSNPIGPEGHGGYTNTQPADQSAASVLAELLPACAH
jgi:predicted dinucleotide-binding enzyme